MSRKITTKPAANDTRPFSLTPFQSAELQKLNEYELGALRSLFLWVATEQDTTPEIVRLATQCRFEASHIAALPRKSYDDVIRFLVNLRIDELS
jgi:hypothetical protein